VIRDESLKFQSSAVSQRDSCISDDNLTEVLFKVLAFTQTRQKIIIKNINCANLPGYVPCDLPVDEFAGLLNLALDEHIQKDRLIFCDTDNIKFGTKGSFEAKPIEDNDAIELLQKNKDRYLEMQINKLLENTLNQRFAAETIKQKQIQGN